jgi:hypothetical protein
MKSMHLDTYLAALNTSLPGLDMPGSIWSGSDYMASYSWTTAAASFSADFLSLFLFDI